MGLGELMLVSLAEARQASLSCRKLLKEGVDPIEERARARQARQLHQARSVTFAMCAEAYIEAHAPGWRNAKHAEQWRSTLKTYAFPIFGDLPVQNIDTPLVMKVLDPIWHTKTETASRLRGRMESVLDWAKARHLREGNNPALWRGHLDQLLPKRSRVQKVVHHPALPFDEMGAFMRDLAAEIGIAARGFEFQILTAARTGEVIGARWEEIDEGKALWVIPGSRMKAGREPGPLGGGWSHTEHPTRHPGPSLGQPGVHLGPPRAAHPGPDPYRQSASHCHHRRGYDRHRHRRSRRRPQRVQRPDFASVNPSRTLIAGASQTDLT